MPETLPSDESVEEPVLPRAAGLGWPHVSRETSPEPGRVAGVGWPL